MTQKQKKQVEKIKKVLSSQRFATFYGDGGLYDELIGGWGEDRKKLEKQVNEKIVELFEIK